MVLDFRIPLVNEKKYKLKLIRFCNDAKRNSMNLKCRDFS